MEAKRKRSESVEIGKFMELMNHGQVMRTASSHITAQDGLYNCRIFYLNQALDAFQQALVYSSHVTTLQTQECLENIRETQVDLLMASRLAQQKHVEKLAHNQEQAPLRLPIRKDPPLLLPSRRHVKVLVPAYPKLTIHHNNSGELSHMVDDCSRAKKFEKRMSPVYPKTTFILPQFPDRSTNQGTTNLSNQIIANCVKLQQSLPLGMTDQTCDEYGLDQIMSVAQALVSIGRMESIETKSEIKY